MSPLCLILWVPTVALAVLMVVVDGSLMLSKGARHRVDQDKTEWAILWLNMLLLILVAFSLDIAGVRL